MNNILVDDVLFEIFLLLDLNNLLNCLLVTKQFNRVGNIIQLWKNLDNINDFHFNNCTELHDVIMYLNNSIRISYHIFRIESNNVIERLIN